MANIVLKTDFKDGQFLYGDDLNNNFRTIEAGVNANEDNLQIVIEQAQKELRNELEEITGERGWDWNDGSAERVTFYKGDTEQVNSKPISNGQLLYDVKTGETALDTDGKRVMTGAGNILAVSEETPTNPGTKVWINPKSIVPARDIQTYPIGSVIIFSDAADYSNYLNMKWQLINKDWKEEYVNEENMEGILFQKTNNVKSYDIFSVRTKDTIRIRLTIVTAVPIGDAKLDLGKLNPEAFGANTFVYSYSHVCCFTDNGDGVIDARVGLDGIVTTEDFISKTGAAEIPANVSFAIDIVIASRRDKKVDSACDKFYWKRIG